MINIFIEDIELDYQDERYKKGVTQLIFHHQKQVGDLNFILCSDAYLLQVNQEYLNHDYYTDIISFEDNMGNIIGGDIFISLDRVKENAELEKVSFEQELTRVFSHGILHFIGFKDKTEEEALEMRKQEDFALTLF